MTQEEKFLQLRNWVIENKIRSFVPGEEYKCPVGTRLIIDKPRIFVIVCDPKSEDQAFLYSKKRHASALFVRDSESMEFIMEKMQNVLKGWTIGALKLRKAKDELKKAHTVRRKRERIHIVHYEKVLRKGEKND